MKREWSVGEVGFHSHHGRCIVLGLVGVSSFIESIQNRTYLMVVREYDGEQVTLAADYLVPIDEWDASKELAKLTEEKRNHAFT